MKRPKIALAIWSFIVLFTKYKAKKKAKREA